MESDTKYPIYNRGTTVHSDNPRHYICHICPEKPKDSLEDHLKDDKHLQRLKYYTQSFDNEESVVECKLCLKVMNLSHVIEHALSHKLIPWYVPENSPEILFKNFFSQREHQYFCHLCNVKLPFWFLVERHNEDSHHQALKGDKIDDVILQNLSFTISHYQLAVDNSIFMKSSKCLSCSLCDCEVGNSYKEIVIHIEGKSHIEHQKKALEATEIHHLPSGYHTDSETPHISSEYNNNSEDYNGIILSPVSHQELSHSNSSLDSSKSSEGITKVLEDNHNASTEGLSDSSPGESSSTSLITPNSISLEKSFLSTFSSSSISSGDLSLNSDERSHNVQKIPKDRTEESPPLGEEVFLTECKFCHQEILGGPEALSDHMKSPGHDVNHPRSKETVDAEPNSSEIKLDQNPPEIPQEEKFYQLPEKLIKLRDVDKFWCTMCRFEGLLKNAGAHATKKRHLEKLEQLRKKELRENQKKVLKPSPPALLSLHLEKPVNPVLSSAPVKPEANGKILPKPSRNVPCEICNCMFPPGERSLSIHRNGREHLENEARVKAALEGLNKEAGDCSPGPPRGFSVGDIPSDTRVEYHYEEDMIECKICHLKIYGTDLTTVNHEYLRHKMSQEHRDNELKFIESWTLLKVNAASLLKRKPKQKRKKKVKPQSPRKKMISCPICHHQFDNERGLHGHMTSHFWERFLNVPVIDSDPKSPEKAAVEDQNGIEGEHSTDSSDDLEFQEKKSTKKVRKAVVPPDDLRMRPPDIATDDKLKIYGVDKRKIKGLKLGVLLSFTIDEDNIYCLVCRKNVRRSLQDFYDHLCSANHLDYLQEMIEDHKKFRNYPDLLSDLALAHEYMEDVSEDDVWCCACGILVKNDLINLNEHFNDASHRKKWSSLAAGAKEWFNALSPRIAPDFYSTWRYWCVPCNMNYNVEIEFREHLNGEIHKKKSRSFKNETRIFDYCAVCATVWYGFLKTYSYHSTCKMHKNQAVHSNYYLVDKIPQSGEKLLHESEKKIEEILKNVDSRRVNDKTKEDQLIGDLEGILKEEYPGVQAHSFGSRMSGLAGRNSDFDISLDCSSKSCPVSPGKKQLFIHMENIRECLENDPQNWNVDCEDRNCRVPIIKATHRPTGIECDISFSNDLSVENTKMIRTYCESYPHCRKLIIFLKNWMGHCELTGVNGIPSCGIAWLVIYFLQVKMILPTISELIERRRESRIIGGWETGASTDFQPCATDESFKELLMQFFRFYEDFDYRNYVICPLVGRAVAKRDFQKPTLLADAMEPYLNYLKGVDDPEPFRIDSVMCLQDPFELAHNICKDVEKFIVYRLKTLCSLGAQILESNV